MHGGPIALQRQQRPDVGGIEVEAEGFPFGHEVGRKAAGVDVGAGYDLNPADRRFVVANTPGRW